MKKIFNINLGGYPFTVDEDAYDKLRKYLENLRRHFAGSANCGEIVEDIENRMAELLGKRLENGKSITSIADVDYVIGIMGLPADIASETDGVEPQPVNAGSNAGSNGKSRRLYRDMDDKVIGGVCSGIANYFGWEDPLWIRIAFLAAIFLGIGSPAIVYIVLMILIPKAVTAAQKLQMRGEPVNIDNIAKTVEYEAQNLSKSIEKGAENLRSSMNNGRVGDFFKDLFGRSSSAAVIIAKVILLLILGSMVVSIGVAWISYIVGITLTLPFLNQHFFNAAWQGYAVYFAGLGLIGIPLAWAIMAIMRILFNFKPYKWLNTTLGLVWTASIIVVMMVAVVHITEFRMHAERKETSVLGSNDINTLHVVGNGKDPDVHIQFFKMEMLEESACTPISDFDIECADSTAPFKIEILYESQGRSSETAKHNVERMTYDWRVEGDSLVLPNFSGIGSNDKWRGQHVSVTLYVPAGKNISFDKNTIHELDDVCGKEEFRYGWDWETESINKSIKMTSKGLDSGQPRKKKKKKNTEEEEEEF